MARIGLLPPLLAIASVLVPVLGHADPPPSTPAPAARPAPPHTIRSADLFPSSHDALPLAPPRGPRAPGAIVDRVPPDPAATLPGGVATGAYVRDLQVDAFPERAPGSSDYYRHLGEQMFSQWQPPSTPPPSVADTVVRNFVAPVAASAIAAALSRGPLATERAGSAVDSLDAAHPNSPVPQPTNLGSSIAEANAQRMRADVEIDQDPHGALIAIRVARSSGSREFDQRALAAAREAAQGHPRRAMPGGWRSRWGFEVVSSRDPLVVARPTLPGEGASITPVWTEVRSDGEVHSPLRTHQRRRVWLVTSRQINAR